MEDRKDQKNAPWLSVPQFGDWDQKGELPDYSVDFSKIREMRKQNKRDASRASLGKEEELINPTARTAKPAQTQTQTHDHHHHYHQDHHDSPATRRSIFRYFNCCVKA
uniref:RIN4 pathogenic type III effector avirulence factor Avr cleavage site domain-containing protein n=1 Tax=Salix viminalis TaxID=40686 RepID=A0A6N2M0V5_SALVM